jgi:hypothetical protein
MKIIHCEFIIVYLFESHLFMIKLRVLELFSLFYK